MSPKLSTSSGGGSAGLDRDHRHVVGDHVVQLPRDALALLEQRALARVAELLLGELTLAAAAHPDDGAEQRRDGDQEDGRDRRSRVEDRGPGHGGGGRGDRDPRLAADRYRVQAQAGDDRDDR
jgi:hypothetical protein